jgi:glycosyltransferase involved in cell wall biosynthesis
MIYHTKILVFLPNYLPGYKAGGILKTISNTVDHLGFINEFKIVTRDRDLGDKKAYDNIIIDQWNKIGKNNILYLSPKNITILSLSGILRDNKFDIIYLNSFFDTVFTLKIFLLTFFTKYKGKRIIIAPRGELCSGCLSIKPLKKHFYIFLIKKLFKLDSFIWQASSNFEKIDIQNILNLESKNIKIALDLPKKEIIDYNFNYKRNEVLSIVFLSRITREKNLDYALDILSKVKRPVIFDIYGTKEDISYWVKCESIIKKLPENIIVQYRGNLQPNLVANILCKYDCFFLPSKGENYGHVIIESLTAGTPVLISNLTPWQNLDIDEMGWDIDLHNKQGFVDILESIHYKDVIDREIIAKKIITGINKRIINASILKDNLELFTN